MKGSVHTLNLGIIGGKVKRTYCTGVKNRIYSKGEGKMDTNLTALMARIEEIRTRIQEIQGMAARGGSSGGVKPGSAGGGLSGPDAAVPPASPTTRSGGPETSRRTTAAETAADAGADFSGLLEQALDVLGQGSGAAGAGDVDGAMDLMSSALNSLSSLNGSGEEESDILMSRESLTRLTDLERVLRGTLDGTNREE
jgi:hypothetical protein